MRKFILNNNDEAYVDSLMNATNRIAMYQDYNFLFHGNKICDRIQQTTYEVANGRYKMNMERNYYSLIARSRNALAITLTEDNAIAAAAIVGERRTLKNG